MFKVRPFWKIMLSRKYPPCEYFPGVLTAWEKGGERGFEIDYLYED